MITIASVGSLKEDYLKEAVNDYLNRIAHYDKIGIKQINEANPSWEEERIVNAESLDLLKSLKECNAVILCDRIGKSITSEEFADMLSSLYVNGKSNIGFIIGGSCGVSAEVRQKADFTVSFSSLTFPHGLFRLILCEQIYRAMKINNNEKYHK